MTLDLLYVIFPLSSRVGYTEKSSSNQTKFFFILAALHFGEIQREQLRSQGGRGGGGRLYPPPIGMSTKMQNEKNTMFLALFETLNYSDLKHILKHLFRGGGLIY